MDLLKINTDFSPQNIFYIITNLSSLLYSLLPLYISFCFAIFISLQVMKLLFIYKIKSIIVPSVKGVDCQTREKN